MTTCAARFRAVAAAALIAALAAAEQGPAVPWGQFETASPAARRPLTTEGSLVVSWCNKHLDDCLPQFACAFAGTVAIGEFLSAVNTLESAKLAEGCFKALLRTEIDVEKDFIPEAIEYREKHDEYHCQDSSVDMKEEVQKILEISSGLLKDISGALTNCRVFSKVVVRIGQFAIELDSGIGDIAEGIELIANANSIVNAIETIIEDYKDHDPQTCPKDGSALGTVLLDLTGLWQQTKEDKEREAKEKAIQEVTAAPAP